MFPIQDMVGLFFGETHLKTTRTPWLWKLQLCVLGLSALAVIAFRVQLLTWRPALLLTGAALATVMLIGFISLLILFAKLRSGRQQGIGRHCLLATALSLPILVGVLLLGIQGPQFPPIHDITTDPTNPPAFTTAASLRAPGDNSVTHGGETIAKQQRQAYADILPLDSTIPPAQAFDRCLATAQALGWQIMAQDKPQGRIEAIDRTLIFGFADDIAIRILPQGNGSRIDLRSASRAGVSDLGVNAKRIRAFTNLFNNAQAQ
jgi:uncharacterized protein (DUF1499 family)